MRSCVPVLYTLASVADRWVRSKDVRPVHFAPGDTDRSFPLGAAASRGAGDWSKVQVQTHNCFFLRLSVRRALARADETTKKLALQAAGKLTAVK